jgi:hypothetical protein
MVGTFADAFAKRKEMSFFANNEITVSMKKRWWHQDEDFTLWCVNQNFSILNESPYLFELLRHLRIKQTCQFNNNSTRMWR